ncbi:MAG: glutathione S-transferase family protein [Rhizobiales bacterium]|nr:glutathione S-transferase family protein [Hyphomicrobiales bacterium]
MLRLVHHPFSAQSRFIRLCLAEYGEKVELTEAKPWERREALLKINPAGTIPILIDGTGPAICGHDVIAEYLDETRGPLKRENRLMPENPIERSEVRRLVNWFLIKMEAEATSYIAHEKIHKIEMNGSSRSPDSQVIRAARANVKPHLQYVSFLAGTRNYLGGLRLTYADLAAAAAFSVMDYTGDVPWDQEEAAKTWYARVKSRPAFRALLAERMRGLPPVSHYADLDF